MLPLANRLRKKSDFSKIIKSGRRFFSTFFVVYTIKTQNSGSRFGIVISSKVSKKAVTRNRIRRWIKSDLFERITDIKNNDFVIIVKHVAATKNHKTLSADLNRIMERNFYVKENR